MILIYFITSMFAMECDQIKNDSIKFGLKMADIALQNKESELGFWAATQALTSFSVGGYFGINESYTKNGFIEDSLSDEIISKIKHYDAILDIGIPKSLIDSENLSVFEIETVLNTVKLLRSITGITPKCMNNRYLQNNYLEKVKKAFKEAAALDFAKNIKNTEDVKEQFNLATIKRTIDNKTKINDQEKLLYLVKNNIACFDDSMIIASLNVGEFITSDFEKDFFDALLKDFSLSDIDLYIIDQKINLRASTEIIKKDLITDKKKLKKIWDRYLKKTVLSFGKQNRDCILLLETIIKSNLLFSQKEIYDFFKSEKHNNLQKLNRCILSHKSDFLFTVSDNEILDLLRQRNDPDMACYARDVIEYQRPWLNDRKKDIPPHIWGACESIMNVDSYRAIKELELIYEDDTNINIFKKLKNSNLEIKLKEYLSAQIKRIDRYLPLICAVIENTPYKTRGMYEEFFYNFQESARSNGTNLNEKESCNPVAFAINALVPYEPMLQFFCDQAHESLAFSLTKEENSKTRELFLNRFKMIQIIKSDNFDNLPFDESQKDRMDVIKDWYLRLMSSNTSMKKIYERSEFDMDLIDNVIMPVGVLSCGLSDRAEVQKNINLLLSFKDGVLSNYLKGQNYPDIESLEDEIYRIFNYFGITKEASLKIIDKAGGYININGKEFKDHNWISLATRISQFSASYFN